MAEVIFVREAGRQNNYLSAFCTILDIQQIGNSIDSV